jgi:hypothetical protein
MHGETAANVKGTVFGLLFREKYTKLAKKIILYIQLVLFMS